MSEFESWFELVQEKHIFGESLLELCFTAVLLFGHITRKSITVSH